MKLSYESKAIGKQEIEVNMVAFLGKQIIFNRKDEVGEDQAIKTSPVVEIEKVDKNTISLTTRSGSTYTLSDELLDSDFVEKQVHSSTRALRCLSLL